ncbi:MAG: BadF/BadG/BcrA/BcrD ATPase family protein [Microvirga sp.]
MTPAAGLDIGIDIGGTKTHLRAYDGSGSHRDLILPTAEWRLREWQPDAAALVSVAKRFAAGAAIARMAVGAHGCDDESECAAFESALAAHAPFPVKVVNDAELLPAALGLTHQIGLVAGTGSIAVCRDRGGRMLVAGGWGWIIGDDGSASGLVREAARAVALHLDYGGASDDPLVRLLFEALAIPSAARIGSAVARQGGAAGLGSHARIVFEAAEQGSLIAGQVIREGARELADLVARLRHTGSDATTVVAGGSVIASQPLLANAFIDQVAQRFDGRVLARIYPGPPVEGACRLAASLAAPDTGDARRPVPSPV